MEYHRSDHSTFCTGRSACVILSPSFLTGNQVCEHGERKTMTENIAGNLHVANEVLADMVGNAAMESYGIVGMAAPNAADGIAKLLPNSRLRRGIVITTTDAGIHVDLYVIIEYGTNINTVSQNLIDAVTFVLKEYARVPLDGVEVHVQGIKVRK